MREKSRIVEGIVFRPLSRRAPGGLVVARMDFPAERTIPDPRSHEGHEWLYVLSGGCGSCSATTTWSSSRARPPSSPPGRRTGWARSTAPPQALAIFGPQGQRVHLRT